MGDARGRRRRVEKLALVASLVAIVIAGFTAFAAQRGAASSPRSAKAGVVVVETRLAYGGAAAGTGIVLTSSGEVLTNNHVIRGASAIHVIVPGTGRSYSAAVVGYSVPRDVALLALRGASGLQTAVIGNSSTVRVGDRVTAIGNAGGTGVLSTKTGRLTALRRTITVSDDDGGSARLSDVMVTSAPLRPGDSGGPLLSHGRVVGIDAAASRTFAFEGGGQGFAIPINTAVGLVGQISAGHATSTVHVGPTAFLGVGLQRASGFGQTTAGAVVDNVAQGSPAETAGLTSGDVITSLARHRVTSANGLRSLILRLTPGQAVKLAWIDDFSGANSATVRLVSGPPQ
jgi:S1-C subfamily serine protease